MAIDVLRRENKYTKEECEVWSSMTSDKIARCICTLLKDEHCLTISDMQWEITAHFSHEASEVTIFHALQQLEMQKVCMKWVPGQLVEEHEKLHGSGTQLPYSVLGRWEWLILANNYRRWKLIHFYMTGRSASMVWKKIEEEATRKFTNECSARWC